MSSPAIEGLKEDRIADKEQKAARLQQQYYQRFRTAQQGVSEMQRKWTVLDTFDRGEQWKNANIPPWVAKPVTNLIRFLRTTKRANLASAIPKVHTTPLDQRYAALFEKLKKAYDHVWEWERVPKTIRSCIDRAGLLGTQVAMVYEDMTYVGGTYKGENNPDNRLFQGKICVKKFPIYNFFPDPDGYRLEDCKWIETTEVLPFSSIKNNKAFREYVEKNHPEGLKAFDLMAGDQTEKEDEADGSILDRTNKPNNNMASIRGDEMVTLHTHWERYLGEDGKWHLDVSYYTRSNNWFLLRIENVKPNVYPFAVYYDEEEDQTFWGTSTAMDALENQKIINKAAQTAAIIATLHQNPQKVVSRESGINAQELARTGTMPGKVWTSNGDPSQSIHNVQPPEIPRGLLEIDDRMKADIKDMAGINDAYTGTSVGSLTTSTGVNSLIERATIRDKDKMQQVDAFVQDISNLIYHFIIRKWKDVRPLAVPQADGTVEHIDFEPILAEDEDNLEWLCKCDTYAIAPMTQALKSQEADNLMQMQGQFNFSPAVIIPQEWIALKNFSNKAEILARMKKDAEILAKKQAEAPPKISPNGEVAFTMTTKDQGIIFTTLEEAYQTAFANKQVENQLMLDHVNNGLNVAPGTGQAPVQQGQDPLANAGQAMNNQNRGM